MTTQTTTEIATQELPGVAKITELQAIIATIPERKKRLAELVKSAEGITVAGHAEGPKKGREAVHSVLMNFVNARVETEKDRKAAKSVPLELGRFIDAEFASALSITEATEAALRADRDAYDNEQKRIAEAAAEAIRAKRQARLAQAAAVDLVPDLTTMEKMGDDEWDAIIETARAAKERIDNARSIAAQLTALGDPCDLNEAAELTDEQAAERIKAATQADFDRKEAARQAEEKRIADERAERARLELVSQRVRDLATAGAPESFSVVEAMSEEEFRAAMDAAAEAAKKREQDRIDAEANAESERQKQARGVERFRQLAALGQTSFEPSQLAELSMQDFADIVERETKAKAVLDGIAAEERRIAEENQRELDRLNAAAEAERLEEERKQREADDEQERQRQEAAKAALAPDIEKLDAYRAAVTAAVHAVAVPEIANDECRASLDDFREELARILN